MNSKHSKRKVKTSKKAVAHRIDALVCGRSTMVPGLGLVKCTHAARNTPNHKRKFSVSKSKVAVNRGGYDFATLAKAFNIHR